MDFPLRFTLIIFATWAVVAAAGGVLASAAWIRLRRTGTALAPARRASLIALLRLAPAAVGAIAVLALVVPAFLTFEPRYVEETSLLVTLAGAGGLLMVGATIGRIAAAFVQGSRLRRTWRTTSSGGTLASPFAPVRILEVPSPVVALLGIFRPELFISRRVIESCDADQVSAILDHERAHLQRRDNLTRLCLHSLVDPLAIVGMAGAMHAAWHQASEQAADDGTRNRMALAEGLVRVARLTLQPSAPSAFASTLIESAEVTTRVSPLSIS